MKNEPRMRARRVLKTGKAERMSKRITSHIYFLNHIYCMQYHTHNDDKSLIILYNR